MAGVAVDQDFLTRLARRHALRVAEASVLESGIDPHFVGVVGQGATLPIREAEAPCLVVVGGPVGNELGSLGQGVQVGPERREGHGRVHRYAVATDVEGVTPEVHHPLAAGVLHEGVTDVPLVGDDPVEDRRAAGHLDDLEGDVPSEDLEGAADALAGDAAADRIELLQERSHAFGGHDSKSG